MLTSSHFTCAGLLASEASQLYWTLGVSIATSGSRPCADEETDAKYYFANLLVVEQKLAVYARSYLSFGTERRQSVYGHAVCTSSERDY
jgi:hypothetical protein